MKKKLLFSAVVIILIAITAVGAWLFFDLLENEEPTTDDIVDVTTLTSLNADTAFDFLKTEAVPLPENMHGFIADTRLYAESDKAALDGIFEKVDAILPNTVVIKHYGDINYNQGDFDILAYLTDRVKEQDMYAIILTDIKSVQDICENYAPDGIMTEYPVSQQELSDARKKANEKNMTFGILCNDNPDSQISGLVKNEEVDFCFATISSSPTAGGTETVKKWAQLGLSCNTKCYAVLRNDLTMTGNGWDDADDIYNLVRAVYNYGGFSGYIAYDHTGLSEDKNAVASDLYFYNEFFNDVDYTALTITDSDITDGKNVTFRGTSDAQFPLHAWCTAENKWQTVSTSGEDGAFSVTLPLLEGENKITIKHKNARHTYYIDRAVDVIKDTSALIEDGILKMRVKAYNGAKVYASVANSIPVELTQGAPDENNYAEFYGEFELGTKYSLLTAQQISYKGFFNGLSEEINCINKKELSPYDDHGLGRADICIAERKYTETTASDTSDDTSSPVCTPQLYGSMAYVTEYAVSDNIVVLSTDTGMKIHAEKSKLILNGYVMPPNSISVTSEISENETKLVFSPEYLTFIKTSLQPQEYFTGAMDRIYNVEDFTAEYIDIMFMNSDKFICATEPDFTSSDVISRCEWYSEAETGSMIMRLYLREKGNFGGYSLFMNEDGSVSLTLKKAAESLEGCTVMLDPGHGGHGCPGANYNMSVYEKDVAMSIALKVSEILSSQGAEVIITRDGDEALFLDERVEMIRTLKPDIFASIHCDGSDDTEMSGTHTFYYRSYSMPLADAIHNRMTEALRTHLYTDTESKEYEKLDNGCKFFPYMVTRVEECPSVLIECGYMTNPEDGAFLITQEGQSAIAEAIAQGITDYITG